MKIKRDYGKVELSIDKNLDYYNNNAMAYYDESQLFNMKDICDDFLKIANIPEGSKILDAGCGSGRESVFFRDKGFEVTAVDGSEELVKICNEKHNLNAEVVNFADMKFNNEFDAVWCCAALLHLPEAEFEIAVANLANALKEDGTMYFSIKKLPDNFMEDTRGRTFYNVGIDKMHEIFAQNNLELVSYYETGKQTEKTQMFENYLLKKVDIEAVRKINKGE